MSFTMHLSAPAASGHDPQAESATTAQRFHLDYATWYARIAGFAGKTTTGRTTLNKSDSAPRDIGAAEPVRHERQAA